MKKTGRISKDEYYLNLARELTTRSTCLRRHYGCVIVKDDRVVATGYNGSPRGEVNCCDRGTCKRKDEERYAGYDQCDSVHAEQNAIISASCADMMGAIVYVACVDAATGEEDANPVPCPICSRMLRNARVNRIMNRSGEW